MKSNVKWLLKSTLILFFVMAGCSKDADPVPDPNGNGGGGGGGGGGENVTKDNVSYTNFVGDLFTSRCSHCHTGSGEGVPHWTFAGYSSVSSNLDRIKNVLVVTRAMPKDGSLSTNQIELLKAWFDKNAPQN